MCAYIHNLSPVKAGRKRNVKYYNMTLQAKEKLFRGVSYRADLHHKFKEANDNKSPVKLSNFKFVRNLFDASKEDVEVNNNTKISSDTSVEFPHALPGKTIKEVPIKTLIDIISGCQDKEKVSFKAFLSVTNRPIVSTMSKFNQASVVKREISANDQSATVRTTLWESKVSEVIKDGVYEVNNAQFRVFANGGKYINVDNHSEIKEIVENIEPSQDMLPDLLVHEIGVKVSALDLCPGDRGSIPRVVKMFINLKCSFRMRPWESLHA